MSSHQNDNREIRELIADINDEKRSREGRTCGSCRLCCDLLNVEQGPHIANERFRGPPNFRKPPRARCRYDRQHGGCELYGTPAMPSSCADFQCLWLEGLFPDEYSPLQTGIVIHGETIDDMGGEVCVVNERRPGQVFRNRRARLALSALVSALQIPVLVLHGPELADEVQGVPGDKLVRSTVYHRSEKGMRGHVKDDADRPEDLEDWSR